MRGGHQLQDHQQNAFTKFKQTRQPSSQNFEGNIMVSSVWKMEPSTYFTVIGQECQRPVRPPQASLIQTNTDAAEIPRYIQLHATQVDQYIQMVNAEDILNQQLLGSLEEKYFKGQRQTCIIMPTAHLWDSYSTSMMIMGQSHQWTKRRIIRK